MLPVGGSQVPANAHSVQAVAVAISGQPSDNSYMIGKPEVIQWAISPDMSSFWFTGEPETYPASTLNGLSWPELRGNAWNLLIPPIVNSDGWRGADLDSVLTSPRLIA